MNPLKRVAHYMTAYQPLPEEVFNSQLKEPTDGETYELEIPVDFANEIVACAVNDFFMPQNNVFVMWVPQHHKGVIRIKAIPLKIIKGDFKIGSLTKQEFAIKVSVYYR